MEQAISGCKALIPLIRCLTASGASSKGTLRSRCYRPLALACKHLGLPVLSIKGSTCSRLAASSLVLRCPRESCHGSRGRWIQSCLQALLQRPFAGSHASASSIGPDREAPSGSEAPLAILARLLEMNFKGRPPLGAAKQSDAWSMSAQTAS